MFKNFFKKEKIYYIKVTAKNFYTNEIEIFTMDNIAFNNWQIGNMMCGDYDIISTERI